MLVVKRMPILFETIQSISKYVKNLSFLGFPAVTYDPFILSLHSLNGNATILYFATMYFSKITLLQKYSQ